ncbi:serine/threonine transporter [Aequitasia blattaphilus]|uniref:Serine/threonine transporter SstT n=1 Tax=Aequitasia blattaphilus TaxID=2949332 RepID=A0ABT1EAQ1_9FIRM|nr:serine/threonine transporter SstT [Aequitasia blattaphilus]MCP1102761.1 serine/threonine transporter SstT [Aequitasia blattaphilus]MCR8615401.1 serine/threonine transporter SstT [Aequitasia blattaphilus]
MKNLIGKWNHLSLVKRIIIGLIIGLILGLIFPKAEPIAMLGSLFVGALKGIAPVLVFFLVMTALAMHREGQKTNMRTVIFLYLLGTFLAGTIAVIVSFTFPLTLTLTESTEELVAPGGIGEVLTTLLLNIVANPIQSLAEANYIGILAWAVILGLALRKASDGVKNALEAFSNAVSQVVRWVINCAPFGIMGLMYGTIATQGIEGLLSYGQLIILLVGTMLLVALVINPIIVFAMTKRNPYPIVFKCLKESGITAFFTRSSAANIPVNMELCKRLGLNKDTYSISIPLGATINMGGAAVTISVLTLATCHTLGIRIDIPTALILCILSAISACGASGVAGGSLLLVPLACSLFGISNDIAMQVVGVGFIVGVIQDSCETALNSSTDALFTATAEYHKRIKDGEALPKLGVEVR